MKIVSYLDESGDYRIGVDTGDGIAPSYIPSLNELLTDQEVALEHLNHQVKTASRLEVARLGPPTRDPSKMLFCGVNYEDHLEEIPEIPRPDSPFFFAKLPSSITGPRDDISIPEPSMSVDYEAELAVVIGSVARRVEPADAMAHVFGYTAVNDVTARNIQFKDQQITLGKGLDNFCPMGPAVTLRDDIDSGDLKIVCSVNGVVKQEGTTKLLIASVAELISYVSQTITLVPGDVIATGTPAGVGYAKSPPEFLAPGDCVAVEIEGIGTLINRFVAGWEEKS